MPIVSTTVSVLDTDLTDVWNAVCDFESYPETMEDVLVVQFLSKNERTADSYWKVLLNGSELIFLEAASKHYVMATGRSWNRHQYTQHGAYVEN